MITDILYQWGPWLVTFVLAALYALALIDHLCEKLRFSSPIAWLLNKISLRSKSLVQKLATIGSEQDFAGLSQFDSDSAIAAFPFTANRHKHSIQNNDYKRGNIKESYYRRRFKLTLLEKYQNRCANCLRNDNGLDIDHFYLSKNEGGCFIMHHVDGYLVNNAVPLCESCNRGKSDKPYEAFFGPRLDVILQKNGEMTEFINSRLSSPGNSYLASVNI